MKSMLMLGNNPQERHPKMPSLCYFISSYLIQCMVSATNGLLQVNAVIHVENKKLGTTWWCVGVATHCGRGSFQGPTHATEVKPLNLIMNIPLLGIFELI